MKKFTDAQTRKEMSAMTLTQKQLEDIKEIHETLSESSDLLDKAPDAWKAILRLGWLIDDLAGVGVSTWAR